MNPYKKHYKARNTLDRMAHNHPAPKGEKEKATSEFYNLIYKIEGLFRCLSAMQTSTSPQGTFPGRSVTINLVYVHVLKHLATLLRCGWPPSTALLQAGRRFSETLFIGTAEVATLQFVKLTC